MKTDLIKLVVVKLAANPTTVYSFANLFDLCKVVEPTLTRFDLASDLVVCVNKKYVTPVKGGFKF